MKFAREVEEPRFEARPVIAGKDARMLATEILAVSEDEFRAAFKGSPMKRATLGGLRRNAAIVLTARHNLLAEGWRAGRRS